MEETRSCLSSNQNRIQKSMCDVLSLFVLFCRVKRCYERYLVVVDDELQLTQALTIILLIISPIINGRTHSDLQPALYAHNDQLERPHTAWTQNQHLFHNTFTVNAQMHKCTNYHLLKYPQHQAHSHMYLLISLTLDMPWLTQPRSDISVLLHMRWVKGDFAECHTEYA